MNKCLFHKYSECHSGKFLFKVVKTLSESTIFLIEEDNDGRAALKESLKNNGYKVSLAIDEEDALERVDSRCVKADLVLMHLLRKPPDEILEIGRNICRTGKLSAQLVVIAGKYGADLEGTNLQVNENEYISYLEDGEQLFDLLSRLTAKT